MAEIWVRVIQIHGVDFIDREETIRKPLNDVVTIGRSDENDIKYMLQFMSRQHGRIFLEKGIFTEHLNYEDFSTVGTTIVHWHGGEGKSKFVKRGSKVKLKPGDWIIISHTDNNGMKYGLILVPSVH